MPALLANPVVLTVLPPLLAGLILGILAWASGSNRLVVVLAWGAGVLFVYWLLEGVPPLPPIAAKQKLGYLIGFGALAGIASSLMPGARNRAALASAVLAAVAVVWLGWSKITNSGNTGIVVLAALLAVLLAAGIVGWLSSDNADSDESQSEQPFLAPGILLTTAIAGSIVAASGLFLGMGQILGALSAMLGGALAVSYMALLVRGQGLALLPPGAIQAVGNALLCVVVLTALLGPSPSLLALIVLSTGPLLAVLLRSRIAALLPGAKFLRPILAGAIIAIPAITASLIAVLTGTSPFA